jgi:hypothetical protein
MAERIISEFVLIRPRIDPVRRALRGEGFDVGDVQPLWYEDSIYASFDFRLGAIHWWLFWGFWTPGPTELDFAPETCELPHAFVEIYDDAEAGLPLQLLGEAPLGQWRRYQNSWLMVARPLMEFPNDPTERATAMADWVSEKMDEALTLIRRLRGG